MTPDAAAKADVSGLPAHLCTPHMWRETALRESMDLLGTPEGAAKLAEARRYAMCAARIQQLECALEQAEATANELRAVAARAEQMCRLHSRLGDKP